MHKQGTSETPGDTGPSRLIGAESDEEKRVILSAMGGYTAAARHFFDGPGQASNALDSRCSMRSQAHTTSMEARIPASFKDALRKTGICRPDRRSVEFLEYGEITKPPPIGHFVRFLLRAELSSLIKRFDSGVRSSAQTMLEN